MPRRARIDPPGAVQHVMVRGIERRELFTDDSDRQDMLERLQRVLADGGVRVLAWVFMSNHVHLLLQMHTIRLGKLMARVLTGYALRFNRRHARVGHLLQNRYHSVLVETPDHLRELFRYVHLNLLRAGMVASLDELALHAWCGYGEVLGVLPPRLADRELVTSHFSGEVSVALTAWMQRGIGKGLVSRCAPLSPADVWGEISEISDTFSPVALRKRSALQQHRPANAPGLDLLVEEVCRLVGVSEGDLLAGSRTRPTCHARAAIAYLATRVWNHTTRETAQRLRVAESTISQSVERGRTCVAALDLGSLGPVGKTSGT